MDEPKATTEECTIVMHMLCTTDAPLTAAQIADKIGLAGCRETQRRRVRAIIKQLRDEGEWIVANNYDGYWLTEDRFIWHLYNKDRALSAKYLLGEVSHRQKAAADRKQRMLFSLDGPRTNQDRQKKEACIQS